MPTTQQLEEELFAAALERVPAERAVFLDGACRGDAELRRRLESLLAMHEREDAVPPPPQERLQATVEVEPPEIPDETVGQKIGRYKILEKVGEGGCGAVYVAEQTEPVRRRVALKVIKLGMDTKQVVARFEAERQALAMMDHPNIAKVLDAGTTDTGRPYFVMELVRGIKITDYCDQEKLDTRQRLDLFIQVCHAIQHAHQKGIIHRDIKPSNILVTLHDGIPVPKVIDFGIAKATEGRLTDATVYTQLHQFIGTPAYMSPEQAEMSGLDIDTRSDIYSLGVLLYELLTDKTPFDGRELVSMGIDAMRKTIREQEPPRPSTRLSRLGGEELTTTAKRHGAEAPKLVHLIRGDLDWIVMKCLEKDRSRRYDTANGLAMDIKRHLNNEPVIARPPSTLYEFQKTVRRHKFGFAATGFVMVALAVGLVFGVIVAREKSLLSRDLQAKLNLSEAQDALAERDYEKAARLLDEIPPDFSEPSSVHAQLRRIVGVHYALQSPPRWTDAANHFKVLVQVDRNEENVPKVIAFDYLRCLPVLVRIHDLDAYEAIRSEAIPLYRDNEDPLVAERLIRVFLLTPPSTGQLKQLRRLGDVLERTHKNPESLSISHPEYQGQGAILYFDAWRCIALALLEYRQGEYTNSIAKCEQQLQLAATMNMDWEMRNATTHVLLAMNYHQLDDPAAARKELGLAQDLIREAYSHPMAPNVSMASFFPSMNGPSWFDWNIASVMCDEAKDLIER